MNAKPTQTAAPAQAKSADVTGNTALLLGGGLLALLVLGIIAYALMRRRRADEPLINHEMHEDWMDEEAAAAPVAAMPRHDPIRDEQPAMIAPDTSAFAWGREPVEQASDDGTDRREGESWVERAYRGPSPANPSASLRNRLKRAAFFDKRERDVAEGKAEPVEADAGLPDAMVEETAAEERELA